MVLNKGVKPFCPHLLSAWWRRSN